MRAGFLFYDLSELIAKFTAEVRFYNLLIINMLIYCRKRFLSASRRREEALFQQQWSG